MDAWTDLALMHGGLLWVTRNILREINKHELKRISGVSSASMAKLGKGQNVTTDVLLRICTALDCTVGDIMEIGPDESQQHEVAEQA